MPRYDRHTRPTDRTRLRRLRAEKDAEQDATPWYADMRDARTRGFLNWEREMRGGV